MRFGRLSLRCATCTFLTLVVLLLSDQHAIRGQALSSKLTTVLNDLATVVPQDATATTVASVQTPLAVTNMPASVQDAMRSRRLRIDTRNTVQAYVLMTSVTPQLLAQLTALGVTVEIPDAPHRRVQVRIPASRLALVAAEPFVTFVRLPTYARRRTGSVDTEGDAILNADVARQQYDIDGTGIKVGVISDGLKGIFATGCTTCAGVSGGPIATGDLPVSTGTRNILGVLTASSGGITGQSFASNGDLEGLPPSSPPCGFPGAGAEGTALLEIVHDIAPGAQLSFANADTDLAFINAVNSLASTNDIVMDDLGFYGEPYDGTSDVSSNTAAALNNTGNRIRTYTTAVGNDANDHYLGGYVDSGVDGTTITGLSASGHLQLFQSSATTTDVLGLGPKPYDLISMPSGGEVVMFLTWTDPFGASTNNYDLYLVRQSTNTVVARSTDPQNGSQDPLESIDYVNTGATDFFRIVVQNVGNKAAARTLDFFAFEPECANNGPQPLVPSRQELHNYNTPGMSVAAEGDSGGTPVSVISVGAICSGSAKAVAVFAGSAPDASCNDPNHATIEFYSSQGPTLDGRTKPDIAGIDGVSTTGAGSFEEPFFGTSAATPHIAGTAALALEAAPCLVSGANGAVGPVAARTSLRSLIVGGAIPLSDAPPDNIFGAGLASALATVKRALPVFQGPAAIAVSGNTPTGAAVSPSALGFSDPDQCAVTQLKWTGGCGSSPGASLTCPFGTATVNISASNNGLSFSDPATVSVTVSNFNVGASPGSATVTAGQTATYQVSLAAVGGAFPNPVALSCANLPAGSSCSFSPASVAPGAGGATSTLTINTTARSSVGVVFRPAPPLVPIAAVALTALAAYARRASRFGRRRRRTVAVSAALGLAMVALDLACGGSAKPPSQSTNTATASVAPASLSFSSQTVQTTSSPQTVTLSNTGTTPLTLTSAVASGDFAATNSCGTTVVAASSCLIAVTFTPSSSGPRTGTLTVADNATATPQTVALSGTGVLSTGGTPAGTYQVAIDGTSGTLVQMASITLVVQ